jgi:hypothetical protein
MSTHTRTQLIIKAENSHNTLLHFHASAFSWTTYIENIILTIVTLKIQKKAREITVA